MSVSFSVVERTNPSSCVATDLGGVQCMFDLEKKWDDLVARSPEPTPFLRAGWMRAWWEAFGSGDAHVVVVHDASGTLVGGAVFALGRAKFEGMPVKTLSLASNVHSNRADLVVDEEYVTPAARALAQWAHAQRGRWSVMRFEETPADSEAVRAFTAELARLGHPVDRQDGALPPFISLAGGVAAFEASLKSKWKSNLRNREKRIQTLGAIVHETVREATPDLDVRLDECFALESLAWKGAAGSAIDSDPATRRFYRALAHEAAATGSLALQTLRVNGKLAAFQLDLVHDGIEYVLKIGYDPELKAYSPGALLLKRVIDAAIARGMRGVDLLGDDMPWKRDWTSQSRRHVRQFAFGRGAIGRSLHALKFRAIPLAKRVRDRMRECHHAKNPAPATTSGDAE